MPDVWETGLSTRLRTLLGPGHETDQHLQAARRKAAILAGGVSDRGLARAVRAAVFAGEAVGALAASHACEAADISELVQAVAAETQLDPATTERELLRYAVQAVEAAGLPGLSGVRAHLNLLTAFSGVKEASLWSSSQPGVLQCLAIVGADEASRRVRAAARETMANGCDRLTGRGLVHSLLLTRWDRPFAALVFRAKIAVRPRVAAFAAELGPALVTAAERATVLSRNAARERMLQEASEKRVVRLAYDIHDGPLQDLAMLSGELRRLRRQVERGLLAQAPPGVLLGRLDDLDARLGPLDRDLRALAVSLDCSTTLDIPLADAVRRQIDGLGSRGAGKVRLDIRGNEELTASQRLVLLALVREGISNARAHGRPNRIQVRVSVGRRRAIAIVEDDGRGFDVQRTLPRAARRGRLGLAGLTERVRLLGGQLSVESAPGGPTRIVAVLPRWEAKSPVRAA